MAGPVPSPDQPVASTSSANVFSFKNSSLEEVLEDLSSRFILNLPEEELVSVERICFQVEQAHWYYEDFIREEEPRFPSMALKTFSRHLFHACPLLQHWSEDHDQAFQDFLDYKTSVPVCGVIMLNPSWTKCVLVKGWKSSSSWSFPRGKINADEPEHECAARETMEETGFDVADRIIMDAVIRLTFKEQKTTLFIVPNVPEDTAFATRTRKEISKIQWFPLVDLPLWKKGVKESSHKFYGIAPVIGPLKAMMKTLRKAEWERTNALRAVQTNGGHQEESVTADHHEEPAVSQQQQWPSDPAILSAQTKPEGGDHLSRLLGGLDLFGASSTPALAPVAPAAAPVTASSRVTNGGPLPTPQATPSAAAAVKTPLPVPPTGSSHIAPIQLLSRNPASASASNASNGHAAFASPTPPHSGDSTKSNANHLAASKSKFEFISPFDALASPPKKRAEANSSTPITAPSTSASTNNIVSSGRPEVKSSATPTPTTTTSSTSPTRPTLGGGRPRGMSAASEHFAPASLSRARYARSRGLSTSTVASVASLSTSASVASVTSPLSVASDAASASENTSTYASVKVPGNGIGPTGRPEREASKSVVSNDGTGSGNGTRQAKHAALLQSLAADLFKSSRSTPALPQSAPPPMAYPPSSVSGFSPGHGPVQFQQQRFGMQPSPSLPGTPGPLGVGAGSTFPLQSQPAGPRPLPLFGNGNGNGNGALPLGPGPPSRMGDPFVVQHPRPVQHQPIQLNGSGIGSGLSHSRSITPTAFTAPPPVPSYPPRDRDGGGPGSPIPVIPPSQPLQRSQLLSLLNGTPAPAPMPRAQSTFAPQQQLHHPPPQVQMQMQSRPVSMHPYQQQQPAIPRPLAIPPNLTHFQGQGGASPLTPGGRPLPQAPYPAPNASAHLGPVPSAAQLPAPGPPPPPPANLSLLSILNQPGPVTSYR